MAIASFEELCKGFCEIAGLPVPALEPDEHGALAFTVNMHDVAVTALHVKSRPENVFVILEFGALPEEKALQGWRVLMDANLILLGSDPHVFGRNPESGDVVLHCSYPLRALTVVELYQRVVGMANLATQWREDYFLDTSETPIRAPGGAEFSFIGQARG